jgi:hypothetical protein
MRVGAEPVPHPVDLDVIAEAAGEILRRTAERAGEGAKSGDHPLPGRQSLFPRPVGGEQAGEIPGIPHRYVSAGLEGAVGDTHLVVLLVIGLEPLDRRKSELSNLSVKFEEVGIEKTFLGLLDAYLRDLAISDVEKSGLKDFAIENGISESRLIELKESYLESIEKAALRDGIITEAEAAFFNRISLALGFDRQLNPTESRSELPPAGSLVCVTGTATVNGVNYDKKTMAELLEKHGLIFTDAISKKSGVALLLQDSAGSQSSKVAKAQAWGIPRMVIADFVTLVLS